MEFMISLPVCLDRSSPSTLLRWNDLLERFNSHETIQPKKLGQKRKKLGKPLLSFLGGQAVEEAVKALSSLNIDEDKAAGFLLDKVGKLCLPKFMLLYERYKFFSMNQRKEDCLCEFLSDLTRVFEYCDLSGSQLLDRIIGGVHCESLRALLKNKCSGLEDVFEVCEKKAVCENKNFCDTNFASVRKRVQKTEDSKPTKWMLQNSDDTDTRNIHSKYSKLFKGEITASCVIKPDKPISSFNTKGTTKLRNINVRNARKLESSLRNTNRKNRTGAKLKCSTSNNAEEKQVKSQKFISAERILHPNPAVVLERTPSKSFFECHICQCHCSDQDHLTSHLKSFHSINVLSITDCSHFQSMSSKTESYPKLSSKKAQSNENQSDDQENVEQEESEESEVKCEEKSDVEEDAVEEGMEKKESAIAHSSLKMPSKAMQKRQLLLKVDVYLKRQKLGLTLPPTLKKSKDKKYNYECAVCGKAFRWPCILKQHFLLKHPDEKMPADLGGVCTYCGKVFKSSGTLHKHESMHTRKRYPCDLCSAVLVSKKKYDYHKEVRHGPKALAKPFVCEVCGKAYRFQCNLREHSSKHSSEKPFQCDRCELSFKKKKTLQLHLRIHEGEAPFKCETCNECFISKKPYENHVRKHSGEKPFICSTCGASFRTKPALSAHSKVHDINRPRPYVCSTCGYSCTKKCNLIKHTLKHTGQKPHKCPICDAGFTTSYGKNKHLRRTHGIQDPSSASASDAIKIATATMQKKSSSAASNQQRKSGCKPAVQVHKDAPRGSGPQSQSQLQDLPPQQDPNQPTHHLKHQLHHHQVSLPQTPPTVTQQQQHFQTVFPAGTSTLTNLDDKSVSGMSSTIPSNLMYDNLAGPTQVSADPGVKGREKDGVALLPPSAAMYEEPQPQQSECHYDQSLDFFARTAQPAPQPTFDPSLAVYHAMRMQNYYYPSS